MQQLLIDSSVIRPSHKIEKKCNLLSGLQELGRGAECGLMMFWWGAIDREKGGTNTLPY